MNILTELTVETGMARSDLLRIIITAPRRYKVYQIPKKNGGYRTIAQPSRELKILQYFLLDRYLSRYPVHASAMGYVKGKNIYENAVSHADNDIFLKLDFRDFFPSIRAADWKSFVLRTRCRILSPEDVGITTQILFWGLRTSTPYCLSIGAPTSPILSNIMLFDLDTKLAALAEKKKVVYTRYADDITISGPLVADVLAFEKMIRREVSRMRSPELAFNDEKRGLYRKGQRRMVTGLVITPVGQVSIGRERKRAISALLHRFSLGQLGIEQMGLLKGLLGFTISNEPVFIERMRRKYGDIVIDNILKTQIPSRTQRK